MKIDYKFKAEVLKTDIPKLANQIAKAEYARYCFETFGQIVKCSMDYDTAMKQRCFLLQNYPKEYSEAEKINRARYKRVLRLQGKIRSMLSSGSCVQFLTLTFNDDTLSKTSLETRRKYVQRYLKSLGCDYVANIDFGAKNGREHYHAVVACKADLEPWKEFGFILAEWVIRDNNMSSRPVPRRYKSLTPNEQQARMLQDSEKALSKYVAKLTNHAIKETTRRCCIMYSRR